MGLVHAISPRRIITLLGLLVSGNVAGVLARLRHHATPPPVEHLSLEIIPAAALFGIECPAVASPLVSVIVSSHESLPGLFACIRSVLQFEPDLVCEIILAGVKNPGEDVTEQRNLTGVIDARIAGTASESEMRNRAAAVAKGEYLCFLGSGVQIQHRAISALVSSCRQNGDVGMVGAKLVRSDGSLEEAGSVVWRDGALTPYGHASDPLLPEFNYFKECDTVNPECVLIRKEAWDRLRGFNPVFQSVVCGVADLAYKMRAARLKVVYQPEAMAVRVSDELPRDLTQGNGVVACVADRQKFSELWKQVLEAEAFPAGTELFWARDRSRLRKTVVFIDQHIPTPDRDAGSRTLFQYLALAVELGYSVKFIAGDFGYSAGYREPLQQRGIEILAGEKYRLGWNRWFAEQANKIHAVVFCRPQVTEVFLDTVIRACPGARRIYYGHDLHWVREEREYKITGKKQFQESASRWKRRECGILERMDCNLSISTEESQVVADLYPKLQHIVFPVFYWNDLDDVVIKPANRTGYLFVGGFAHRPNVDGLLWFLDSVWPIVRAKQQNAALHVVGSHAPSVITERKDDGMTFHGYVDDETLTALYRSSRVAVIPLRYGAGVKGKTVEAMRHGLPLVSTSIGLEGLPDLPPTLRGIDEATSFAARLTSMCEDEPLWEQQSRDQLMYVRRWFSKERAVRCLREAIEGHL